MKNQYAEDLFELLDALSEPSKLPNPRVLRLLSKPGDFPRDWETGKRMQNDIGIDAIPMVCECEIGAGFWARVLQRKDPP